MLHVDAVSHAFATTGDPDGLAVLDDVSLHVADGEFVSIVGPSGCGKSTLLQVVAGLVVPHAGRIDLDAVDHTGRPGSIAYMPQQDALLPWRTVLDNAILGAEIQGRDRDAAREQARGLLGRFGLEGFAEAWPDALSGGMRQRLALLRTFLAARDLLVLDEPFGALDAITRRGMWTWLAEVLADDPRAVLFVTHDVEEALVLSDRVVVMSRRPGRLVGETVLERPRPRSAAVIVEDWFVAHKAALLDALEAAHTS